MGLDLSGWNQFAQNLGNIGAQLRAPDILSGLTGGAPQQSGGFLSGLLGGQDQTALNSQVQQPQMLPQSNPQPQQSGFLGNILNGGQQPQVNPAAAPEVKQAEQANRIAPADQGTATYIDRLASIENPSGNPHATSSTGATGEFQFLPSTWAQYGGGGDIHGDQTTALMNLTTANNASLSASLGRPPTAGELYLAHQQGAGGAATLLSNPNATPASLGLGNAVKVNGGDPNAPASQFTAKWTSKFADVASPFGSPTGSAIRPDQASPGLGTQLAGPVPTPNAIPQAQVAQAGQGAAPGAQGPAITVPGYESAGPVTRAQALAAPDNDPKMPAVEDWDAAAAKGAPPVNMAAQAAAPQQLAAAPQTAAQAPAVAQQAAQRAPLNMTPAPGSTGPSGVPTVGSGATQTPMGQKFQPSLAAINAALNNPYTKNIGTAYLQQYQQQQQMQQQLQKEQVMAVFNNQLQQGNATIQKVPVNDASGSTVGMQSAYVYRDPRNPDAAPHILPFGPVDTNAVKDATTTTQTKNYDTAVKGGYKGSFIDFLHTERASEGGPKVVGQGQALVSPTGQELYKAQGGASLSPETINELAGRAILGDNSGLVGIGRGRQGSENLVAVQNRVAQLAAERNVDPQGILDNIAEFGGQKAGARTVGNIEGKLQVFGSSAAKALDQAATVSDTVPRTQWMPVNKVMLAIQAGAGDVNVVKANAATETAVNEYTRAIGLSGASTDTAKAHAYQMLGMAQSPEQYRGVTEMLKWEVNNIHNAAKNVAAEQRKSGAPDSAPFQGIPQGQPQGVPGAPGGGAPMQAPPMQGPQGNQMPAAPQQQQTMQRAPIPPGENAATLVLKGRQAIQAGAPAAAVGQRLQGYGIDPRNLVPQQ